MSFMVIWRRDPTAHCNRGARNGSPRAGPA